MTKAHPKQRSVFQMAQIGSLLALSFISYSCSSKVTEAPPKAVVSTSITPEERLKGKDEVDSRLDVILTTFDRMAHVLSDFDSSVFKALKRPADSSIEFDLKFFVKVNDILKESLPEFSPTVQSRSARIHLSNDSLSDDCSEMGVKFELTKEQSKDLKSASTITHLKYSLQSCETQGDYQDFMFIKWVGQSVSMQIKSSLLSGLVTQGGLIPKREDAKCELALGSDREIQTLSCQGIILILNSHDSLVFQSFNFSQGTENSFSAQANFFRDTSPLGSAILSLTGSKKNFKFTSTQGDVLESN